MSFSKVTFTLDYCVKDNGAVCICEPSQAITSYTPAALAGDTWKVAMDPIAQGQGIAPMSKKWFDIKLFYNFGAIAIGQFSLKVPCLNPQADTASALDTFGVLLRVSDKITVNVCIELIGDVETYGDILKLTLVPNQVKCSDCPAAQLC